MMISVRYRIDSGLKMFRLNYFKIRMF